jgi:hypothetical protein
MTASRFKEFDLGRHLISSDSLEKTLVASLERFKKIDQVRYPHESRGIPNNIGLYSSASLAKQSEFYFDTFLQLILPGHRP